MAPKMSILTGFSTEFIGLSNPPVFQYGSDDIWRITMQRPNGEVSLREVAEVNEVVHLSSYPVSIVTTEHDVWIVETAALPKELQG